MEKNVIGIFDNKMLNISITTQCSDTILQHNVPLIEGNGVLALIVYLSMS